MTAKGYLAMPAMVLFVFLASFAQPISAGETVSLAIYPYYTQWKNFPDFRAFYAAGGWQGGIRSGTGWAFGRSAGQPSVESAVYLALTRCNSNRKKYEVVQACRLYALGDVVVAGMGQKEQERVAALYRQNQELTKRDLQQTKLPPATMKKNEGQPSVSHHNDNTIERSGN